MSSSAMVKIPGGRVRVGSDAHYPEERPAREIELKPFWIDRTAVTNAAFAEFVAATGWITTAETQSAPGSLVFHMTDGPVDLHDPRQWWSHVAGANWRYPEGSGSRLLGKDDHPVVHVSKEDALAYATWRGVRLPDEWEWEAACRGGIFAATYAWGDAFDATLANIWIGAFPWYFAHGGKPGTCAVDRYPANGYGVAGMIGNVWEWTSSPFAGEACCGLATAATPALTSLRGGSYLCAADYCLRYRPAARIGQEDTTTSGHIGFRCARDA
jgi:formylglycine-generating enzyme